MAEITRVYRQSLPAMKFVGRCYREEDKENGVFSNIWSEWFDKGLFKPLELPGSEEPFEDCNAYCGLSECMPDGDWRYWIGVFMPPDAAVPDGYESIMMDAGDIAVCWVYGAEPDIYMHCCLSRLEEEGCKWSPDKNGVRWCFERYVCPRFTEPDGKGNRILDQCFYVSFK